MEEQGSILVDDVSHAGHAPGPAAPPPAIDWYAFVGTPDAVSRRLFGLPSSIQEHLFYALLLQGDGKADLHVFERAAPDDREGPVHMWQGSSLGSLPGDLVALLPARNATAVLTEVMGQMRDVLRSHGNAANLGVVPCPPTPRGAFGHPLKRYAGDPVIQALVLGL